MRTRTLSPAMPRLLRRSRCQDDRRTLGSARRSPTSIMPGPMDQRNVTAPSPSASPLVADARVDDRVQHVGHEVAGDDEGSYPHEAAHEHRIIPTEHRMVEEETHAGPREDDLHDDDTREQR